MAKQKAKPTPEEVKEAEKMAEVAAAVISAPVLGETPEEALKRMAYESRRLLFERGLDRPFHSSEIKWKPQMVKGNRCMAIAYLDARTVMDRLDDVCGVDGWRDEFEFHGDGSVVCRLTVMTPSGLFITKSDVGSPSEQPDAGDRKKAAVSDALKRAAVHFGIGRYLYRLPHQWVDYDPVRKRPVNVPQLPAWALPKKEIPTPGVYVEPDELHDVAAAATSAVETHKEACKAATELAGPAVDEEAAKKKSAERAAAASAKSAEEFRQKRLAWWYKSMAGCETPNQLTELIAENLKDEPGSTKPLVWDVIQEDIKKRNWKWSVKEKQVIVPGFSTR